MLNILLVLWLATLGADRIDFSAGHTFFIATPFLVLSPLVLFTYVMSRLAGFEPRPSFSRAAPTQFLTLIFFFLTVVLASVLFGGDIERGAIAYTLLFYETTCIVMIVFVLRLQDDASDILLRGARVGVLLCLVFSSLEFVSWLSDNFIDVDKPRPLVLLAAHTVAFAPRLSAVSLDPNRAGLLLVFYWFLLTKLRKGRVDGMLGGCAVLLLFCTLSRSAIVSWLCTAVWMLIRSRERQRLAAQWKTIAVSLLLVVVVSGLVYSSWESLTTVEDFDGAVTERVSLDSDTSGGLHLELLRRGLGVWAATPKNVVFGIGYGSSAKVLTDIFQTKYANFHSIYVSMLAESGIIALAVLVALLTFPLRWGTAWTPLLAGVLVFNVFYQTTSEPFFWLFIVLMWMNPSKDRLIANARYFCSSLALPA